MDSRLGKNLGGLLEGCGGQEGLGLQRCLGDTQQNGDCLGKLEILLTCSHARGDGVVDILQLLNADDRAKQQLRGTGILNADLTGHLTCDDLDMLIVDVNRLRTVNALDFLDDILIYRIQTQNAHDVGGSLVTLGQTLTDLNMVAIVDRHSHTVGDRVLVQLARVVSLDGDFMDIDHLTGGDMSNTADLGHDRGLLGCSRLEELFDTGKTLRNIGTCDTTGVEGSHRQLGTGLTDCLCGDDTDGFTDIDQLVERQVSTVAVCADTVSCMTLQQRTDIYLIDTGLNDRLRLCVGDHGVILNDDLTRDGVNNGTDGETADDTVVQRLKDVLILLIDDGGDPLTLGGITLLFSDDNVLRNVNQTAGQITGVCGTQSGIGQRLTGTTGTHEVLQDLHAFTEVGLDRDLDGLTVGSEHQTAHTCELTHLCDRTTGSGVGHDLDRVVAVEAFLQGAGNLVGGALPDLDDAVVALLLGEQTAQEVLVDNIHFLLSSGDVLGLLLRNGHVIYGDGDGGTSGVLVAGLLDMVKHMGADCRAVYLDTTVDDLTQVALLGDGVDLEDEIVLGVGTILETEVLRNVLVEDQTAEGGVSNHVAVLILAVSAVDTGLDLTVDLAGRADIDGGVDADDAVGICHHRLVHVAEDGVLTGLAGAIHGEVVGTKHHILRRNGNGTAVDRLQQVVGGQHQEAGFRLCLSSQRDVNRHLVTVEVGVERSTYQRVQLDGTAINQHGLERLNGQTVQCRCTVQKHGMLLDDILQSVPDLGEHMRAVDLLLRVLDVGCLLHLNETLDDEGLEQLERHLLRQTALIDLQRRTNDDNGTAGVVNTLTQQVLTEATLLTAQHLGQRLERTVGGTRDGLAAATVIDQRVNCLLQHSLLVAHHDLGGADLKQLLETVVTSDDTTVQLVEVRGSEATAVQLNHGTDVGGDDGNDIQNHPLQLVAGLAEGLNDLQTLDDTGLLLTGSGLQVVLEGAGKLLNVDALQQLLDGLCAHANAEGSVIHFTVFEVLLVGQHHTLGQGCRTGIQHDVLRKVQHLLELLGRDIEHQRHAGGDRLEIPDVGYGRSQLNVTHSLTANLLCGHIHAALFALVDFLAVRVLILTAHTSAVLRGTENALAEQTADLSFQRSVVDGLGLGDLAVRPFSDHFRRRQTNFDRIKFIMLHSYSPYMLS